MSILDLILPKKCVGCNKIGSYLCLNCKEEILQTNLVCPICERMAVGGITHPLCRGRLSLDGLWSLGVYQNPLKRAIQKLKYKYVRELGDELVILLINYWARCSPLLLDQIKRDSGKGWLVIPVPLHWQRQNWRGFNQSSLLAKSLAKRLGLEYKEVLKRVKNTKSQVKLDSFARRQNIKNAFLLVDKKEDLSSKSVILVDDVWTTGATLRECCRELKKARAKKVWALTLAR